uniref:Pinin/SDK/MemA protein domain-containing protein n=1 Tax=Chenopodium quinoa TaxID=63459 RepID=A0A803LSN3_CHEQI
MVDVTVEKTEEELRKELEALQRQQREVFFLFSSQFHFCFLKFLHNFDDELFFLDITERIRDPKGLRRGGFSGNSPRNFGPNQRGFVRPDEPPAKRRLCSAVVKVDGDGEVAEGKNPVSGEQNEGSAAAVLVSFSKNDQRSSVLQQSRLGSAKNSDLRADNGADHQVKEPRVLPKDEDPRLVNRNRRMLGQLLGTLEAEQKACEESEKLRQQERERMAENKKRDLVLRARVAAKAEEKKLKWLFLQWSEHHKKLTNFLRTKTEPQIYYMFAKSMEEDAELSEKKKEQAFLEWKTARREELSAY